MSQGTFKRHKIKQYGREKKESEVKQHFKRQLTDQVEIIVHRKNNFDVTDICCGGKQALC